MVDLDDDWSDQQLHDHGVLTPPKVHFISVTHLTHSRKELESNYITSVQS